MVGAAQSPVRPPPNAKAPPLAHVAFRQASEQNYAAKKKFPARPERIQGLLPPVLVPAAFGGLPVDAAVFK